MEQGEIKYKNWIDENSAASLETFSDNSDKFMSFHYFVADIQKAYLSFCKNNLEYDTCITEIDFMENYYFVIQKSVQAFYYDILQATIHPFNLYQKKKNTKIKY